MANAPKTMFQEGQYASAHLKLNFALEEGLEIALIVGAAGVGKTTVLRQICASRRAGGDTVVDVFYPQLTANELISFIDAELRGDQDSVPVSREESVRRIANACRILQQKGESLVLAIDDAQHMSSPGVLEVLQSLLNLRDREGVRLTLLLAGDMSLLPLLKQLPPLYARIGITAVLTSLDFASASAYVHFRLATVHAQNAAFSDDVVEQIVSETHGSPRELNRLVDLLVLLAASHESYDITRDDVRAMAADIGMRLAC